MLKNNISPIEFRAILKDDMEFWETIHEMFSFNFDDSPERRIGAIIKGHSEIVDHLKEKGYEA